MLLTKDHFLKVFPAPEVPTDNDFDLASNWLLNHGHREPSQRIKTALKNVMSSTSFSAMLHQYMDQMKTQVFSLQIDNTHQLERTRTYFLFPIQYLQLDDHELNQLERTLDALLKLKITRNMLGHDEFLEFIGLDIDDFTRLEYEQAIIDQIASFSGIWNQSFLNQIDHNELSKKELSKLRINEIFDIVSNFPHSICALQDLRQCINPSQRVHLVNIFTQSCNKRLLHAGINTEDIIVSYTNTIKSFLLIDPRGVLLDNASRPIRRYLKEREDTIPTIVNALLKPDEKSKLSRLSEELTSVTEQTVDELTLSWSPDPIDALPDFKKQDIIESLISIFDTKEVFISEFSEVFSKSLLAMKKYDISEILLKLQLLKAKFGEGEFTNLDVMVRDISDSKIANFKIHEQNQKILKGLQFSILSYMFWPELPSEEFKLPADIQEQIELYLAEYSRLKNGRKMNLINAGVVDIQLELKDRSLDFEVTPDKAAVIYSFDGVDSLKWQQISESLEMDSERVKDCLNFWVHNGVLKEELETYKVLEVQEDNQIPQHYQVNQTSSINSAQNFETYWPFIVGMLSNLGSLPSARIQSFLSMTLPKEKQYNATIEELENYLEKCVIENKLVNEDGSYKLP